MSNDSIKLHPEYGVNPSVVVCFWCGQPTGELILFGAALNGEAPRETLTSYTPCRECAGKWVQGFVFIEAVPEPTFENQPEISPGAYPTGNYAVINPEAATKVMGLERTQQGASLISHEQFQLLVEKTAEELPNEDK